MRLEYVFYVVEPKAGFEPFDLDGSDLGSDVKMGVASVGYGDCVFEKRVPGDRAAVVPQLAVDGVQLFTASERKPCLQALEELLQFLVGRVFNNVALISKSSNESAISCGRSRYRDPPQSA